MKNLVSLFITGISMQFLQCMSTGILFIERSFKYLVKATPSTLFNPLKAELPADGQVSVLYFNCK